MVNPNDKRTHPTSRPAAGLSKIYDAKRFVCDQIAACILFDPKLETEFPVSIDRDMIDPELRSLLVLASISMSELSLCKRVLKVLGPRYLSQLILLILPVDRRANFADSCYFRWYVKQLQGIISIEQAADNARRIMLNAQNDAKAMIESINGRF